MTRYRVRAFIGVLAIVVIGALPAAAAAQDEELPAVGVESIAEGLTSPVALVPPGDGSGRLFVVDQAGLIRVLMPDGTLRPEPFLDLRSRWPSGSAFRGRSCCASRARHDRPSGRSRRQAARRATPGG